MDDAPLSLNAAVFAAGAGVIWWAGTLLERYADIIAQRTGLGHAFTGMLLLAGATSLPEVGTTATAIVLLGAGGRNAAARVTDATAPAGTRALRGSQRDEPSSRSGVDDQIGALRDRRA